MNTEFIFIGAVILAALLDVAANLLLARSNGFRNRKYGLAAIALVMLAFTCLAFAVRGLDLPVAYAMWGGFGIIGTSAIGWLVLGQHLNAQAWLGMALLIGGISLLHLN